MKSERLPESEQGCSECDLIFTKLNEVERYLVILVNN